MSSQSANTTEKPEIEPSEQIEASPNLTSNEELAITTKRRKTATGD